MLERPTDSEELKPFYPNSLEKLNPFNKQVSKLQEEQFFSQIFRDDFVV